MSFHSLIFRDRFTILGICFIRMRDEKFFNIIKLTQNSKKMSFGFGFGTLNTYKEGFEFNYEYEFWGCTPIQFFFFKLIRKKSLRDIFITHAF